MKRMQSKSINHHVLQLWMCSWRWMRYSSWFRLDLIASRCDGGVCLRVCGRGGRWVWVWVWPSHTWCGQRSFNFLWNKRSWKCFFSFLFLSLNRHTPWWCHVQDVTVPFLTTGGRQRTQIRFLVSLKGEKQPRFSQPQWCWRWRLCMCVWRGWEWICTGERNRLSLDRV